jgi:hypothetical protein
VIDTIRTESWIVLSFFLSGFRRLKTPRLLSLPWKQSQLAKPPSFKMAGAQ